MILLLLLKQAGLNTYVKWLIKYIPVLEQDKNYPAKIPLIPCNCLVDLFQKLLDIYEQILQNSFNTVMSIRMS
jgi:hypothetical protein